MLDFHGTRKFPRWLYQSPLSSVRRVLVAPRVLWLGEAVFYSGVISHLENHRKNRARNSWPPVTEACLPHWLCGFPSPLSSHPPIRPRAQPTTSVCFLRTSTLYRILTVPSSTSRIVTLTQHYCLTCSPRSDCTVAPGLLCVRVPAPGSRAVRARHGSSVGFHVSFVTPESRRVILQNALRLVCPGFLAVRCGRIPTCAA